MVINNDAIIDATTPLNVFDGTEYIRIPNHNGKIL